MARADLHIAAVADELPPTVNPVLANKGQRTTGRVLHEALRMAGQLGFEGLTFGTLAQQVGLSKSGLFAHFRSMEDLQLQTLALAERYWVEQVLRPALREPRGVARLAKLFDGWIDAVTAPAMPVGSALISAVYEFDDLPDCAMRDAVLKGHFDMRAMLAGLVRQAVETGGLQPDTDPAQFTFEFVGIVHAHHHEWKLTRTDPNGQRARAAFERLLHSYGGDRP